MADFIQTIGVWGVALTLACFALGTWINKKTGQAIFNPLLLGSIFVIIFLRDEWFSPTLQWDGVARIGRIIDVDGVVRSRPE